MKSKLFQNKSLLLMFSLLIFLPSGAVLADGGVTSGMLNPGDLYIDYNAKEEIVEVYSIKRPNKIVHGSESYRFPLKGKVKPSCEKKWVAWYAKQANAKVGTLINQREDAKMRKKQLRLQKEGGRLSLMPPPQDQGGGEVAMDALSYRADMLMNKVEELSRNPRAACP